MWQIFISGVYFHGKVRLGIVVLILQFIAYFSFVQFTMKYNKKIIASLSIVTIIEEVITFFDSSGRVWFNYQVPPLFKNVEVYNFKFLFNIMA